MAPCKHTYLAFLKKLNWDVGCGIWTDFKRPNMINLILSRSLDSFSTSRLTVCHGAKWFLGEHMLLGTTAREREVIPWHSSAQPLHRDKNFVKSSDVKFLHK